ncbi:MAG: nicotinate-nucleotide adenylyltransferase [Methylococcaceae bacterium]|nr:nicotinate-nucleotide adenylyltransferase [Methylococcaceae bacterium]
MIGIYGGTFDPVHFGHLRTALELKSLFKLTEVRLIPCANPPHRAVPLTPPLMRLQMLQLALANRQGLVADACELARTGPSYTIDTLRELRAEQGDTPMLLFMGMDAFAGLALWHQWQHLFDYAHIVVITRPGFKMPLDLPFFDQRLAINAEVLPTIPNGKLFFQSVTQLDISATAIRLLIARREDPHFLLPDSVIDFILQHKLYKTEQAAIAAEQI